MLSAKLPELGGSELREDGLRLDPDLQNALPCLLEVHRYESSTRRQLQQDQSANAKPSVGGLVSAH